MRVVQLAPSFPPRTGGVEFHVQHLSEALRAKGHEIAIITARVEGEPAVEEMEGVTIYRTSLGVLARRKASGVAGSYDVLHAHAGRSPYSAAALVRGARFAPQVYTPHCYYPASDLPGRLKRLAYDLIVERAALRAADRVIALTEGGLDDGVALGGILERFRVVPNAVDFEANRRLLEQTSPPTDPYPQRYVLFAGRIDRNKHVDFLIDAIPALVDLGLKLVVIGPDGGALKEVRARARVQAVTDCVDFRGRVPRGELLWAIAHADLVALPSRYEGLPTSVLEAAAIGTPVVAAATGGTPYLMRTLGSGFCFPLDDQREFMHAVQRALAVPAAVRVSTAGYVREHYSWTRVAEQVLDVYREVC